MLLVARNKLPITPLYCYFEEDASAFASHTWVNAALRLTLLQLILKVSDTSCYTVEVN